MPNRKLFHEYIRVSNLREGRWIDDKMVTVYCDLIIGPFTLKGVSYKWATGSLRLNQRKSLVLKASYVSTITDLIKQAIKETRNGKTQSSE